MARTREIALPWTQQPQEAVRLSGWARQQGFRDLILPSAGTRLLESGFQRSGGAGTPTNGVGTQGISRKFASSSDFYQDGGSLDPTSGYVWVWVGNWSSVGTWSGLLSRTSDNTESSGWGWQRRGGDNDLVVYQNLDSVTLSTLDDKLSAIPAVWIGGWDKTDGQVRLFRNGALIASAAMTTPPAYTAGVGQIKFASSRDTAATSGEVYLAAFAVGRGPTAELADSLFNPWRLLEDRRIPVPYSAAAPGAVPTITAVYADSITKASVVPRVTLDFA